MSEHKDNAPKIRFPGFTDAWEQCKLGDIIKIVGGATPSKANKAYWGGDIVWLSSQEIKNRYVSAGTYTITEKAVRESATKVVPAFTPLIVSRSGILARMFPITLPTVDVAINQDIKALLFDNKILDTDFLVSQLEMKENTILTSIVKTGTTVQSVNMSDFQKLIISIPSIQEQHTIGKTFKNLDNLITHHQRKLNNVKKLKVGLLQKMFPKNGEDFPEVRFPGFTDAWEQRKAKDIFNPIVEKGQEELPVLSVTQESGVVYRAEVGIDIKYDPLTLKNYKVIHPGNFVISLRSFQGGFELSDKLGIASPAYTIFVPKETKKQDNLFWKTQFKTFNFIELLKTVTFGIRDGKSISFSEFGNLKLHFPSNKEEQTKIGTFFTHLDHLITLYQRKLEHLQEQKKALLQQMFI
ncbi:restriction endonuclease subunit S [Paenibacillus polymyxa]|uniref:restriction endonuclease subunit S n=1 Tax=Paenibacillus polymyxa TaxID=1406 RepID=UPI0005ECBF3F|nr:restriction endonuclease subunit S [Paenibacillus polymyxa]KJK31697.1 hypothetical protein TY89_06255 [Paenibacillus polymyxa]